MENRSLNDHEVLCAERYNQIVSTQRETNTKLDSMDEKMDRLHKVSQEDIESHSKSIKTFKKYFFIILCVGIFFAGFVISNPTARAVAFKILGIVT